MKKKLVLLFVFLLFFFISLPCYSESYVDRLARASGINDDRKSDNSLRTTLVIIGVICGVIVIVGSFIQDINKNNSMKKCPFCANDIKKEAVVCQYCHKDVT